MTREDADRHDASAWDAEGANLVFVFSPPRSGSTMLQFMLASHPDVRAWPEPWIMVPLKYLGYYAQPRRGPYDVVNASLGLREFVARLPGGEGDYLDALRAYAGVLYDRARTAGGAAPRYFVDKTPANVLHWRLIVKVFPRARYVVLVRHPLATAHSLAETFFVGDYRRMAEDGGLPDEYIRRISEFVDDGRCGFRRVRYEDLVAEPEQQMRALLEYLELPYDPRVVEYGGQEHAAGSLGDPMAARRHTRPVTDAVSRWAAPLRADAAKRAVAERFLAGLSAEELQAYGYSPDALWAPLTVGGAGAPAPRRPRGGFAYRFQRRVFFALRRLARRRRFRALLQRIRYYCDVVLRDS